MRSISQNAFRRHAADQSEGAIPKGKRKKVSVLERTLHSPVIVSTGEFFWLSGSLHFVHLHYISLFNL